MPTYLKLLTKTINQVLQTPGARCTVAQASFDAWVKYYRQDENTPNATVSYYTKGSLVALCLDLHLRREGKHHAGRRDARLWKRAARRPHDRGRFAGRAGGAGRAQLRRRDCAVGAQHRRAAAGRLAGRARRQPQARAAQLAQRLGLRVAENHSVQIKTVLRGGAAEQAGFAAGDEWLGLQGENPGLAHQPSSTMWRFTPAPKPNWWPWWRATAVCWNCP
jgi:predicted metalloprotease with PDZ domain